MKTCFFSYTLADLKVLFKLNGLPPAGAGRLFTWHYKHRQTGPCELNLAKVSREFVAQKLSFDLPEIDLIQESEDRTVKFLFKLADGNKVETVLIPSKKKYGICLSSQVGCAMKCSFCHTGAQGLSRNLETHEIVGQYLAAQRWLSQNRTCDDLIATIVFMGQGEPLHNFDAVKSAIQIFISQHGLSIGVEKITISTSGYLPGLQRWKDEMPDVNIALSLHSTDNQKRSELIPINTKYRVEEVLGLIDQIPKNKKRFVIFEFLLVKGFNDSEDDARALGNALQGKKAFVNLIPFNPYPGARWERPSQQEVEAFKSVLDEYGIPSLARITKGSEILAACGQLNSR